MAKRALVGLAVAALVVFLVVLLVNQDQSENVTTESELGEETGRAKGLEEEIEEHEEATLERVEAAEEAAAKGILGQTGPIRTNAAPGWQGESLFNPRTDDWEPAIATDPSGPYVYILTTRYGGPKACKNNCPSPNIILEISRDNGRTWTDGRFLCVCRRFKGQFDPEIEVTAQGVVYAAWMNDFNVYFAKSKDHGRTWSEEVPVYGQVAWTDKPILATSKSGKDVYIAFNKSDSYIAQSHDFGNSWAKPVRTNDDDRYYFAGGGFVASDGTVTFAETSYEQSATGPVKAVSIYSMDKGATWHQRVVDTVAEQPPCLTGGCEPDFYGPQAALAGSAGGNLVIFYNGASTPRGPQRMYARRSSNGGRSWTARTALSPKDANAAFPAAVGRGGSDVRMWYMDDREQHDDAWNVWYRRSRDGGVTWSGGVRISDAVSGAAYKSPKGFLEPYGDYGEVAIDSAGQTQAVWGEGFSWTGPGGTWHNRTLP